MAGLLALAATGFAFRVFPADLSLPVSWLWIPLFGGAVFVNAFGLAAITLMVPWEAASDYLDRRKQLRLLSNAEDLSKIASATPAITSESIPEPLRKQIA
jgi:hypothetical protein